MRYILIVFLFLAGCALDDIDSTSQQDISFEIDRNSSRNVNFMHEPMIHNEFHHGFPLNRMKNLPVRHR